MGGDETEAAVKAVGVGARSTDHRARACAELVGEWGASLIRLRPEAVEVQGRRHRVWRCGGPPACCWSGTDTVWPMDTLARWPFTVTGDRATGPGVFDMKAGLVQMFHALSVLDELTGVTVLVTSDEELGSPTSRQLTGDEARGARAVFRCWRR